MSRYSFSSGRPQRIMVPDFAGRKRALPDEASAWENKGSCARPDKLVLLGLGPGDPAILPFAVNAAEQGFSIYWVESPEMLGHIKNRNLPSAWKELSPNSVMQVCGESQIWFYKPGMAIAPDFWSPLLASLEIAAMPFNSTKDKSLLAWLPGNEKQLLHRELVYALRKCGYKSICQSIPEKPQLCGLDKIWQGEQPGFILSVNFRGLDPGGRIFSLCRMLKIPLAIWLVDNPWNLLSAIPLPWWRKASIFVTDSSFIEPLKKYGAEFVHFCPLAFAPHLIKPVCSETRDRLLFVGRSSFPDKSAFFKGLTVPEQIREKALKLFSQNLLPDYHWCAEQLNITAWPGLAGRIAALCADEFSAMNRARWLDKAWAGNLDIIGDEGWRKFLPKARVLPPVDYYGSLVDFYGGANAVLNVTSLLLPQSLNQRHFDVWAAGGFLLSDDTEGLRIFPGELTEEIKIGDPGQLGDKIDWLYKNVEKKRELQEAWRDVIFREHTYENRVELMRKEAAADLQHNFEYENA